jgi:glycosyltransferase involved in cell wall biosynthesis
MTGNPRVSVIIPTYNTARYIAEAVESVLAQTYCDFEVLVVDDGSTDNTHQVLQPYLNKIEYIWQENQERAHTRNNGIRRARGEFIAFLDSDDVWRPGKLAQQVAALDSATQAVLAYGVALNIDEARRPLNFWGSRYSCGQPDPSGASAPQIYQPGGEILFGTPLMPSVVLVRRAALDQTGLFDPQATPVEDWELWLRLAQRGAFAFIPTVVCEYRAFGTDREVKKRATDHHLARWLYVVQKTAANDPQHYPPQLITQVLGSLYTRSAFASYELGDAARGSKVLAQALGTDPALVKPLTFSHLLEEQAKRILEDTHQPSLASDFLNNVLRHLPPAAPTGLKTSQVLSRVYMAQAFQSPDDPIRLRQSLQAGIALDPTWLFNRGVIALFIKTLFSSRQSPLSG